MAKRKRADVIGDDAKGDVRRLLRVESCGLRAVRQRACVFFAAQFFELVEDRSENVGLVIRDRSGEIGEIFGALNDRGHALETHSGIDVALRQRRESAVRVRIELDEHQIPNLDAARVFFVHQRATGVAVGREIDMHFRARPARAGVAHHPEIVRFPAVENVNCRIEIGLAKQSRPMIVRFLVELARFAGSGFVNSRVKPLAQETSSVRRVIPTPIRSLLF